jgi:hypothetical protein
MFRKLAVMFRKLAVMFRKLAVMFRKLADLALLSYLVLSYFPALQIEIRGSANCFI